MTSDQDSTVRVVAIDDDEQHLKFIATVLASDKVSVLSASTPQQGLDLVHKERPHLVLVDLLMPGMSGMEVLEKITQFDASVDVVLLTGQYSTESAVEAIQKGAADYLTKPVDIEKLQQRLDALVCEVRKGQRRLELEKELLENSQFATMIGQSSAMLEVFRQIRRVAPHFRTVLLTGETGVGKELAAQALHRLSPAAAGPFVTCDCSAVVATLAESELFGHVKGSFTGAVRDAVGVFEAANGGTLFLDEIGELPLALQPKLLRVLQKQEIQRVGSTAVRRIDVRVVAATHRDLHEMVREQTFREDLFYRLSMVHLKLPSLAQRTGDLPLLQRYFIQRFAEQYRKQLDGITRRAETALAKHSWPGNIRELENVIGNACMMCEGERIDVGDLPDYLRSKQTEDGNEHHAENAEPLTLEEMEKKHATRVLESVGGNKVRAAEMLGVSRSKLYRILGEKETATSDENRAGAIDLSPEQR